MFVTPNAVDTQLVDVCRKLGIDSPAELAAMSIAKKLASSP
jgi:hypothetical protein